MAQVCSIFSQLLKLVRRQLFDAAIPRYGGMRHTRGLPGLHQLVAILFCQLGHAHSLREIRQAKGANGDVPLCLFELTGFPSVRGTLSLAGLGMKAKSPAIIR